MLFGMICYMTKEDREVERERLTQVGREFDKQAPARHRGDLPKDEQAVINAEAKDAHARLAEMAKEDKAQQEK
ncbi:hypothetical protein AR689_19010 [Arthrobacter sp. EpRS71]|nr:hypothetical protein AR689_19010 [Arthrobacter sp. EpRS71]